MCTKRQRNYRRAKCTSIISMELLFCWLNLLLFRAIVKFPKVPFHESRKCSDESISCGWHSYKFSIMAKKLSVVKRAASLFNSFCSNVAKHVARFFARVTVPLFAWLSILQYCKGVQQTSYKRTEEKGETDIKNNNNNSNCVNNLKFISILDDNFSQRLKQNDID